MNRILTLHDRYPRLENVRLTSWSRNNTQLEYMISPRLESDSPYKKKTRKTSSKGGGHWGYMIGLNPL